MINKLNILNEKERLCVLVFTLDPIAKFIAISLFIVTTVLIFILINISLKLKHKILSAIVSLFISIIIAALFSFFIVKLQIKLDEADENILNESAKILKVEKESIKYLSIEGSEYNYGIKVGTRKYGLNYDYIKDEIVEITEINNSIYKKGDK
jgi:energy-coupling factor transporter transmembrane protein EcfT